MSDIDSKYYENEKRLGTLCLLHGIDRIEARFNGEGDSGCIEDIRFFRGGDTVDVTEISITAWGRAHRSFNHSMQRWEEEPRKEESQALYDFTENHVYTALEDCGVDWVNRDGGFGTWEWTPSTGVQFDVHQRHIEEILEHSEERPLGYPNEQPEQVAS